MCHTEPTTAGHRSGRATTVITERTGPMEVRVHEPSEGGPPVVVIPDYFGPSPFYDRLAGLLRDAGHTAVLIDPYHDLPSVTAGDHEAALRRLAMRSDADALQDVRDTMVAARRWTGRPTCGVVGFCAGGTWAMCLAEDPAVVAVAFYGFPAGLPGGAQRLEPVHRTGRLRSPLLALWGDHDEAVGSDAIQQYRTAAAGSATTVVYPGVGHGFLHGLVEPEHDSAPTAQEAWEAATSFLRQRGPEASGAR